MTFLDRLRSSFEPRQRSAIMKVVAVTRILDECDIVEAFVRHTAQYASTHIFLDNGSQDGTLEILKKLKKEGLHIKIWYNKSVSFNERDFNTFLFRDAVSSYAADWVLCLDADEFIDDRHVEGGLLHALAQVGRHQAHVRGIDVPSIDYHRSRTDDEAEILVPRRIRRRTDVTDNSKVFVSGALEKSKVSVGPGNHSIHVGPRRLDCIRLPGLALAHFADRSPYQVAAKWVKGWAKVLAAGPNVVLSGTSIHYRAPFQLLRDAPERLFRSQGDFLESPENHALADDPIAYRGGALIYTAPLDEPMRAIRMMMGYIEELAARHGILVQESAEAKHFVDTWNADLKLIDDYDPSSHAR